MRSPTCGLGRCRPAPGAGFWRRRADSNRRIEVLQTSALVHLATSPRCVALPPCRARLPFQRRGMVPRAGLEPTRAIAHGPLKTACLPFHHLGRKRATIINGSAGGCQTGRLIPFTPPGTPVEPARPAVRYGRDDGGGRLRARRPSIPFPVIPPALRRCDLLLRLDTAAWRCGLLWRRVIAD